MGRLLDQLRARAAERFVGREAELALIEQSFACDPPAIPVFFVHGPGGIGKTSLLERVCAAAAAHGLDSLRLDARDIEPSPQGVLRALGAAWELPPGDVELRDVVARWSHAPRRVLLIDTFECLAHLEGWLRETVLAQLPETCRVVIAGRARPDAAWHTDPLWREGARVVALGNLSPAECERHLAARGVPAQHHVRIAGMSTGHPLALTLLADVVTATGAVPSQLGPALVRELAQRFTAQAPSELHRRALEVCAHARVTTEALLSEAVDRDRARELFEWLLSLSFIESGPAGLFPHDLVRDAIDDELHWRHRERHRQVHRAVRQHLIRLVTSEPARAASHAFDILFLHRHAPALQSFVDFGALGSMYFEPGASADLPALRELMRQELPTPQHAAVVSWWGHPATQAWSVRAAPGRLDAATLSIDLAALTPAERARDPVFSAVWQALQAVAPPRRGDLQLLARWNLAQGGQRRPSAAMNALQMSQFYQWLTLPDLGAFVICVEEPQHWEPMMTHIGFGRMAGCDLDIDGLALGCYLHDWRAAPMGAWLVRMEGRELGFPAPAAGEPDAGEGAPFSPERLEQAVRDALRQYHDPAALGGSALVQLQAVRQAAGQGEAAAAALQRLLLQAAQLLRENPRDQKFWRALELTYFRPVGSQELAAERLGLPFGTYRYQLATGISRIAAALARTAG